MADLLGVDFAVAAKERLYRCLDRILEHKQGLFVFLRQRWQDLFQARFDVLMYDLTSTYLRGEAGRIQGAKRVCADQERRAASQGDGDAAKLVDGHYLLSSNMVGEDPAVLWEAISS